MGTEDDSRRRAYAAIRRKLATLARTAITRGRAPIPVVCYVCGLEIDVADCDVERIEGEDRAVCLACLGRIADVPGSCTEASHGYITTSGRWHELPCVEYTDDAGHPLSALDYAERERITFEVRACDRCGQAIRSRVLF